MKEARHSYAQAISYLCSLGLFLAGYIFYSSSLIQSFYAAEFKLTSWQIGLAQSAVPLGAVIGAVFAGRLSDLLGRHRLLVWNFLLLVVIGLLGSLSYDFYSLCLARVLNGFLAGTLYPLCAAYLTEMTPQASLARQSAFMMFINCLSAPVACVIAILLAFVLENHTLWRAVSVCHAFPAFIAYLWSKKLPESQEWLLCDEKLSQLTRDAKMTWGNLLHGIKILFSPTHRNVTICLIGAWFLMDVAYYGINFFVPYLLRASQVQTFSPNFTTHSLLSNGTVWGTLIINMFLMLGAFTSIFVVERIDLIKLQKYGFLFSSISLFLLASYFYLGFSHNYVIILLFIFFNLTINVGPNVTTYLLSATSYPVHIRASGHGFIAGFAKFGSFLGVLFLPLLQDLWGYAIVIFLLAMTLFTAYVLNINFSKAILKDRDVIEPEVLYETS